MEILISVVLLVVVIPILVIIAILLLASLGAYLTKIALGTTVFISVGGNLKEVLPNVGGYRMSTDEDLDGRHWLIPSKDENERMNILFFKSTSRTVWFQKWLWRKFGVKFISLFWPQVHVHKFDLRKGGKRRLLARAEIGADAPLRALVADAPDTTTVVDSLLFTVPRPIYLEGIELAGDNSRINLVLLPVFRQVIPVVPVYYLKGDFFTLLDAAIEAMVVDFFATYKVDKENLTYGHWLGLVKAGEDSPLQQHLQHINVNEMYVEKLVKNGKKELVEYIQKHLIPENAGSTSDIKTAGIIPGGIVPRFGFALVSFRIVEWEAHESTKALAESLLAKETKLHTAEGVREEAYGARDAKLAQATGDSGRALKFVTALVDKGVDANVAARVFETQIRTENIGGKDSKIVTYIEGGAPASVMVPAQSSVPTTK